jgi:integrase
MKGHFYKPGCKCNADKPKKCSCGTKWTKASACTSCGTNKPKDKKCTCDATWGFLVDDGTKPLSGRRKQKFKGGFTTKKEAELAFAKFMADRDRGIYVEESNITFESFAEEWLTGYQNTGKVKISTIRVRKHEIKRLSDYFAKLKLKEISRKMYQDALNDLKAKDFADNTIDGAHRTGRMIFKRAFEIGNIRKDPTEFAFVPKLQKTVEELEKEEEIPKYLEREELVAFLHTAKWKGLERDHVIFSILAHTGMRSGELCALKWSDIDFEEQTISITKTYYNPTNNIKDYTLLPPKTPTAKRIITVERELLDLIEDHRALQNRIRMRYRNTYHDKDFVIAKMDANRGYPEYLKTIENRMRRLLKYSELNTDLTPHSIRHTHVSLLAEAGVPIHEIMDRLGHKDDDTTKHIYLHVTKGKKKEASFRFSQILKDTSVK